MSYTTDVPISMNMFRIAERLVSVSCDERMLWAFDSRNDHAASNSPEFFGFLRMADQVVNGINVKAFHGGNPAWFSNGFSPSTFAAARGAKLPHTAGGGATVLSGGHSKITPITILDYPFSSDASTNSGTPYTQMTMTQLADFVRGNPASGQQWFVRQPWFRMPTGVTSVRFRGYRNTGTDASATYVDTATPAAFSMAGAEGWQFTDLDCGAGSGAPGVGVIEGGAAVNETGTFMYLGPPTFVRGTPGNRTPGGILAASLAIGGDTTRDFILRMGGGGAAATCTLANFAWFLKNVYFSPTIIVLRGFGQNRSGGITGVDCGYTTDLANGITTGFEADVHTICDLINQAYVLNGDPLPDIVIINDFRTANQSGVGYTQADCELRGRALYKVCQERGCMWGDLLQIASNTARFWSASASDGVHLNGPAVPNYNTGSFRTGNGSDYIGGLIWQLMTGKYEKNRRGLTRPRV